jgi:hypothetical protein
MQSWKLIRKRDEKGVVLGLDDKGFLYQEPWEKPVFNPHHTSKVPMVF